MNTTQRANATVQALAGLAVGADAMVAEVSREVAADAGPEAADAAALLFSKAVGMRMVSRWRYSRWWYGLTAEEKATLEAICKSVARRLDLPAGLSTARVARLYSAHRGLRPKQVKRQVKRQVKGASANEEANG